MKSLKSTKAVKRVAQKLGIKKARTGVDVK